MPSFPIHGSIEKRGKVRQRKYGAAKRKNYPSPFGGILWVLYVIDKWVLNGKRKKRKKVTQGLSKSETEVVDGVTITARACMD